MEGVGNMYGLVESLLIYLSDNCYMVLSVLALILGLFSFFTAIHLIRKEKRQDELNKIMGTTKNSEVMK